MKKEVVHIELETENGCVIRAAFSPADAASFDPDEYQRLELNVASRRIILTEPQWRGLLYATVEYLEGLTETSASQTVEGEDALLRKLNMPVEELDLSVRADNGLQRAGIRYVGELVQKTEQEMMKIGNFGRKSLKGVKGELVELGLSMGMGDNPTVKSWQPPAE